jgi:[protein-PII] uridylyltransferase
MPANIAQRARERLNFTADTDRLAACKEFLRTEMNNLRARHKAGTSGLIICHERAEIIDALLTHLFDYALQSYQRLRGLPPAPVTLVALGGYGRSELSPWSDVDVMFLFPTKTKPAEAKPLQAHLTDEILYFLWDCNL